LHITTGCHLSTGTMPPVVNGDDPKEAVTKAIEENSVMVFSKSWCPFCKKLKAAFKLNRIDFEAVELDELGTMGEDMQKILLEQTGQKTVPSVFINGKHIGGSDTTMELLNAGTLFKPHTSEHDYDLVVIGGGSGGLACAKEASRLGLNVACLDFVKPSPPGTTWGLGGTCVNVGCIPKKLMHQAAILGEGLKDAKDYGWKLPDEKPTHDWAKMIENIQTHVKGLNWGYKVALRDKKVKYLNELGAFVGPNKLELTNKKGVKKEITATNFVVAVGGRPKYPDVPGAKEYAITSDDLFSLENHPGSTLIVGASYIALECAGFLKGIGVDVTVMVRSILLRGFDQQMADKIGEYMENDCDISFVRPCVPTKIEKIEDGSPGKLKVTGKYNDGTEYTNEFNTVLFATGRVADTDGLNLPAVGVKTGTDGYKKIIGDEADRTNVPNIYAIGDVLEDKPELTPMAIQAGKLLARRICGSSKVLADYKMVATTVFTPLEYGTVGYAEEDARKEFGDAAIDVYHSNFWPLEWTVAHRPENSCYVKLVVNIEDDERILGFHYLGPNAGEVTQAFAGMMKLKATKADMEDLVGIHPTCAEIFTTMNITKSSGKDAGATGC